MAAKYSGQLFPLEAGQVIIVSGKAKSIGDCFGVDLTTGNAQHNCSGDIQFHMAVRFAENFIVRNAHTRGVGWGHEERQDNLFPNNVTNPIRRGANFKIAIYIDSSMFFVTIDEKPYCMFPHRKPLHETKRIMIKQDVEEIYQVDQITAQPNQWPLRPSSVFSGLVPKNFRAGNVIVITATPRGGRGDFALNLRDSGFDRILFHLRPYLGSGLVVLDDQDAAGSWRSQINCNPQPFPFNMDQRFKLAIAFTSHSFTVAVNGRVISSFPYRDGGHKVFGSATGFEILTKNGLRLEVQGVEHQISDCNCHGFENFSL